MPKPNPASPFQRRNKYRVAPKALRTDANGKVYASKAEMLYAAQLRAIGASFIEQPRVMLGDSGIVYVSDFYIKGEDGPEYVDVKGVQTPVFKLKKKLWKVYGPAPLRIVRRDHGRFVTVEIVPKGTKADRA